MKKNPVLLVTAIASLAFAPMLLRGTDATPSTESAGTATCPATAACPVAAALTTTADEGCPADCEKACCASKATLTQVKYEVQGLSCADCEGKVTATLASLKGVGTAKACSKEKLVQVAYDAKMLNDKELLAAIKKAGFKVDSETVELKVQGMTCGGCSGQVSEALTKLKGIKTQEVCHESGNAIVKFDPEAVSREKVLAAIDATGFKVLQ